MKCEGRAVRPREATACLLISNYSVVYCGMTIVKEF